MCTASFLCTKSQIPGVQAGSKRSLQIINEVLYYKGRDGICAYTGGTPRKLSGKLGLTDYGKAVAGQDGRGYIISMERQDTKTWETLRYDLESGLWMAEDRSLDLGGAVKLITPSHKWDLTLLPQFGNLMSRTTFRGVRHDVPNCDRYLGEPSLGLYPGPRHYGGALLLLYQR